jgi:hypothetical protein
MANLAITRHTWHGDWNYTPHPDQPHRTSDTTTPPQPDTDRAWLTHPALTAGTSPTAWDELITRLTVPRDAQREADLHNRRGGMRQAASCPAADLSSPSPTGSPPPCSGNGSPYPPRTSRNLFNVTVTTINKVIRETHPLLDQIKHVTEPTVPPTTLAEFTTYATAAGVTSTPRAKPRC